MNLSKRTTFIAKLVGYALLVGIAIATMIPLLWLVTSSFKTANEVFAVPLKLLPEPPPQVKSSPYIDPDAYPSIQKPDALVQTVWEGLHPHLSTLIWEEARKHIDANDRMRHYDQRLNVGLQNEMVEGIWKQLIAGLPGEVWSLSTSELMETIRAAIIPEAIDTIWDSLYYEVVVGNAQLEDLNFNRISVPMSKWERASENVTSLRELTGGTGLSYRFDQNNTVQITASVQSPIPIEQIRLISIPVHGDASYHHLRLSVSAKATSYEPSRPFVLSDSLWRNSVWRFHGQPSQLESDHIPMSPGDTVVGEGKSSKETPSNDLRLKLEVYRPSYLSICWDKFTYNYRRLWEAVPYNRYFINSVFISTASTLLTLFFCSLGGYAFAKYRFRGQKLLFGILLASMMIPFQVLLVPLFGLMYDLRWLNSYKAIIIPFSAGAFGIFLMRQFIVSIPSDLIDAARIDGCSEFGIYYRIILPVIKPALGALTIYSFLGSWNSYLWPLIILRDESKYTLPLGLANLVGVYRQEYGMLMAGTLLSLMPIIILFLAMQREFVQGITLGSVKE